jgi:hypothetical protein
MRAGQLMGEVGAAEKEAQRRSLAIHLRRLRALLDLGELEAADIVTGRRVGGAAEKFGKSLNIPDIVALRLVGGSIGVIGGPPPKHGQPLSSRREFGGQELAFRSDRPAPRHRPWTRLSWLTMSNTLSSRWSGGVCARSGLPIRRWAAARSSWGISGAGLMDSQEERERLAELDLIAGKRAKAM